MNDIYQEITNKIINALDSGKLPWLQPWQDATGTTITGQLPLRSTGQEYQGINTLMLWLEASTKGYKSPYWMTYKQASEHGGNVKKGEKASRVVYWSIAEKKRENEAGEEETFSSAFLKTYFVFNAEQCEGLPEKFYPSEVPVTVEAKNKAIEHVESFIQATDAKIEHSPNQGAYYRPSTDSIMMPHLQQFRDSESYYAVLLHELTHWTKHESRLNRDTGRKSWGDAGYAMEELVAELGAAFLCAKLGITPELRDDHAAYIQSWLRVLKDDKKAIFTASGMAQKAASFLYELGNKEALKEAA